MGQIKKIQDGSSHIVLLGAIVVLAVVGAAGWRVLSNDSNTTNLSVDTPTQQTLAEQLPADLTGIKPIAEIYSLAEAQKVGVTVTGVELESEDGQVVYVVHFSDGSIVAFDANSGDVVQLSDDNDDDINDDDSLPSSFVAGISIKDAIDIAKAERPGSTLEKVELEVENGIVVFSVRFTDESRVDVRADNGKVQRLKDENGTDVIKLDDDFDDDGVRNPDDNDDDDDGIDDDEDSDDDNDGVDDENDDDDDNDGSDDEEDDDDDEVDDHDKIDNSGSGSNN